MLAKSSDMVASLGIPGDVKCLCSETSIPNETSYFPKILFLILIGITIDSKKTFQFLLNHQLNIHFTSLLITIFHDSTLYMQITSSSSKLTYQQSAVIVE